MLYKHIEIDRHGGPEVMRLVEDELPEPGDREVRLKVLATVAAFTDGLIREGFYPGLPKPPFSLGYVVIATIDKLGSGVVGLELGQRVVALTVTGGYSEYLCFPGIELVSVPPDVDSAEAVCLVLQYVTAYQLLHRVAKVKPGGKILIHSAAGGVGTALLELGRLLDLEMYGTVSQHKQELVRQLGGIPIDYRQEDFGQRVREMTDSGVDIVFDGIGGMHFLPSYQALRRGGSLIGYGFSSLNHQRGRWLKLGASFLLLFWLKLWPDGRQVTFYSINTFKQQHPGWFQGDLTILLELLAQGQIKPVIADRLPLSAAAHAHELLEQSAVNGQLVLLCDRI